MLILRKLSDILSHLDLLDATPMYHKTISISLRNFINFTTFLVNLQCYIDIIVSPAVLLLWVPLKSVYNCQTLITAFLHVIVGYILTLNAHESIMFVKYLLFKLNPVRMTWKKKFLLKRGFLSCWVIHNMTFLQVFCFIFSEWYIVVMGWEVSLYKWCCSVCCAFIL